MKREDGGIVLGWLFRLVASLAVVGVLAFEAGAIVVARVNVDTVAGDAAGVASAAYAKDHDAQAAEAAAREYVGEKGGTFEGFRVGENGRAVFVTVSKQASTLFLDRVGFTESWTVARSTRRRGTT